MDENEDQIPPLQDNTEEFTEETPPLEEDTQTPPPQSADTNPPSEEDNFAPLPPLTYSPTATTASEQQAAERREIANLMLTDPEEAIRRIEERSYARAIEYVQNDARSRVVAQGHMGRLQAEMPEFYARYGGHMQAMHASLPEQIRNTRDGANVAALLAISQDAAANGGDLRGAIGRAFRLMGGTTSNQQQSQPPQSRAPMAPRDRVPSGGGVAPAQTMREVRNPRTSGDLVASRLNKMLGVPASQAKRFSEENSNR